MSVSFKMNRNVCIFPVAILGGGEIMANSGKIAPKKLRNFGNVEKIESYERGEDNVK